MPFQIFDTQNKRLPWWAIAFTLMSISAVLRFWAMSQTPFANGWDSYFYLVQLKSLEETGRMHSPEASLIYPYLRLFYWLTGDYVIGMKVGAAVLAGLFSGAIFWTACEQAQNSRLPIFPLVLAAGSVFSPHLTYFAAQYPKNLLGVVLFVAFMGCLARISPPQFSKLERSWAVPVILLVVNYFAHRLTFALASIYLLFWLCFQINSLLLKKLFTLKNLIYIGALLGLFIFASLVFPGLFHISDFGRLKGVLSWQPQFAPCSFVLRFGIERVSGWWLAEVALVTGYGLLVTGCWLRVAGYGLRVVGCRLSVRSPITHHPLPINPSLLCLCILLLFPFLEWSFTGVAWRFFLVFVLITPLLVIDCQFVKFRGSGLIFAAILICCSFFSWKNYNPKIHDPDYERYAAVTTKAQQIILEKQPELVVAHNALAEYFTFATGIDAMPWLPEYAVDSSRLWRVAFVMNAQTMRYYAGRENEKALTLLGYGYLLLPEHVWQTALHRAKAAQDEGFLSEMHDWRNPAQQRPSWLLNRKRGH